MMVENDSLYFTESQDALFVLDEVGVILSGSNKCVELFNQSREQLVGSNINDMFEATSSDFLQQIIHIIKNKESLNIQGYIKGEQREVQIEASYLSNDTLLCKITLLDTTQIKDSGDLVLFIEKSPHPVVMFDTNMNYITCSEAWEKEWGFNEKGFSKHTIKGRNHYDVFNDVKEDWKDIHARGLNGELLHNNRDHYINNEGEQVWLNWQVRPWYTKTTNAIGGILLFTEIITEQVEIERALLKSEETLNLFFSQSLEGFFIMEAETPVLWDDTVDKKQQIKKIFKEFSITKANESMAQQYGLAKEQLIGHTYIDFFKNDLLHGYDSITRMLDDEQQMIINKDYKSNGQMVWLEGDYLCLFNKKKELLATFGIQRDITQRVKDEHDLKNLTKDIVKSNDELRQFAYITSHDLRAPVVNLKTLLQFYEKKLIHKNNVEIFEKIETSVNQLDNTLTELIDVVAVKNKPVENSAEINFEVKIKTVLASIEELITKRNAQITYDFSEVSSINYPNVHLTSFLQNLITNALKYSSIKRRPIIKVTTSISGEFICLEVKDNGIGIDMEKYGNQVFGLYKKFHDIPDSKGLGLYLVKNQVESLGGRIEVKSRVDNGTTFTLFLVNQ